METLLKEYIRDENNDPRGVVIVVREGDEVTYGFSLLNTTQDTFNKKEGLKIAVARAKANSYKLPDVPDRLAMIIDGYSRLQTRAVRYFKDLDESAVSFFEDTSL